MSEYYALVLFNEVKDRFTALKARFDSADHQVDELTDQAILKCSQELSRDEMEVVIQGIFLAARALESACDLLNNVSIEHRRYGTESVYASEMEHNRRAMGLCIRAESMVRKAEDYLNGVRFYH